MSDLRGTSGIHIRREVQFRHPQVRTFSILLATACLAVLSGSLIDTLSAEEKTPKPLLSLSDSEQTQCLTVLRTGLKGSDFWPAMHAAEALTLSGRPSEVIEALSPLLAMETDDQKRCGIARELARAGQRKHVQLLLDVLGAESTHGHTHAAESLFKVSEIGDGRVLRKRMQEAKDPGLKVMSAAALARGGSPSALQMLRELLAGSDATASSLAAWALGQTGDRSDIPAIERAMSKATTDSSRAFFENALAILGDSDGLSAMEKGLSSSDPAVRTYAANFAADAKAANLKTKLLTLLDDSHTDAAIRAAQSLLVMSQPAASSATEDVRTVVFEATKENPRYTEGSVIELNDGSLLAAITEFHESDDDFAKARIVARQSFDNGRTWNAARTLQENTGMLNVMSVTLKRLTDSSVGMFYLQKNSHSQLNLYLKISNDETQSFGPAIQVTTNDGYHVVNNDRITILSSGRLLAPAASTPDVTAVNHFVSRVFISDDAGKTWRPGSGHVNAPQRGAMEPEVIELNDGRILMIIRNQLGFIGKSISNDGGDTWSPMESLGVKSPEAPATIRRIPATGDLLLVWNNTFDGTRGHGGHRTPLTAAISSDEGQSWILLKNLESDPALTYSYTSLTFVRNRAVLSYWINPIDSGKYSSVVRSLPVNWFYQPEMTGGFKTGTGSR
ncbi:MAG: exo-alpha-sialidase [Planctomyces sp.]